MNEKNLIPTNKRTKSEVRALGQKGGIKSGEVRREKRMLADAAKMLLAMQITDKEKQDKLKAMGIKQNDMTNAMLMTVAVMERAQLGDTTAFNAIRDLNEKPKDTLEVSTDDEAIRAYENAAKAIRGD